jgi:c-di-AMP phosphodiesterase-like protein
VLEAKLFYDQFSDIFILDHKRREEERWSTADSFSFIRKSFMIQN